MDHLPWLVCRLAVGCNTQFVDSFSIKKNRHKNSVPSGIPNHSQNSAEKPASLHFCLYNGHGQVIQMTC